MEMHYLEPLIVGYYGLLFFSLIDLVYRLFKFILELL